IVLFFGLVVLIGCSSEPSDTSSKSGEVKFDLSDSLTFWDDAAIVIFENCTPCHHSDGAGPFSLTSFEDVKKRTKTLRQVVADDYMPPWPADPTYSRFKDEKFLSEKEKQTLISWIDQGAIEGTPNSDLTPTIATLGSPGNPDLVLSFRDTVKISGDNRDLFRIAKIPIELPRDTVVKAIYFKPDNRQLVHHVNGHLINYDKDKKDQLNTGEWIIDAESMNSLEAYKKMDIAQNDGTYPRIRVSAFNYLPGVEPSTYPEGIGGLYVSEKSAFLLNTLHYGPSPLDTFDYSHIEVYFAEKRPERPVKELHMGTQGITDVIPEFIIPAGEVSTFRTRYIIPQTMSVLTVNPHMHLLGIEFEAFAYSPNQKDTIPLIRIPEWDFRWQYFYNYEKPLILPKGYTIEVVAIFDNTINNPFNPHSPPKTLTEAGENMKTTDEMFQFFVNYIPYKEGDENMEL
ncbi:MAG: cytochrome c, partial [Bacteroidota bacterium]